MNHPFNNNIVSYNKNDYKLDNINNFFNENVKFINTKWKKMNDELDKIRSDIGDLEKMFNKYEYNQHFLEGAKYLRQKECNILAEMNNLFNQINDVTN